MKVLILLLSLLAFPAVCPAAITYCTVKIVNLNPDIIVANVTNTHFQTNFNGSLFLNIDPRYTFLRSTSPVYMKVSYVILSADRTTSSTVDFIAPVGGGSLNFPPSYALQQKVQLNVPVALANTTVTIYIWYVALDEDAMTDIQTAQFFTHMSSNTAKVVTSNNSVMVALQAAPATMGQIVSMALGAACSFLFCWMINRKT